MSRARAASGCGSRLVLDGLRGLPVEAATAAAVRDTGALLEGLGHHVEEAELPVDDRFGTDFLRYWAFLSFALQNAGGYVLGADFDRSRTESLTQELSAMFGRGAVAHPGSLRRLRRMAREHAAVFDPYDLVVSPVTGHPAPPIGHLGPDVEGRAHLVRLLRFASFTAVQNISGAPAISLPLGRTDDGRPIGVQVAARTAWSAGCWRSRTSWRPPPPGRPTPRRRLQGLIGMAEVVVVEGLRKAYGGVAAVDGIDLRVSQGEIFGILGPNGAGKTTTVECVEGARRGPPGRLRLHPGARARPGDPRRGELRQRIGAQLQSSALPDRLRVGEALALFHALSPGAPPWSRCSTSGGSATTASPRSAACRAASGSGF